MRKKNVEENIIKEMKFQNYRDENTGEPEKQCTLLLYRHLGYDYNVEMERKGSEKRKTKRCTIAKLYWLKLEKRKAGE